MKFTVEISLGVFINSLGEYKFNINLKSKIRGQVVSFGMYLII